MMVTEEEARTKWCPQTQISVIMGSDGFYCNKPRSTGNNNKNCIASKCMVWRWDIHPDNLRKEAITTGGYCGLAK